ncbi:MAG: hypothetical protein ACRC6M_13080 [Microcystaceae cyanobacterium]
MLTAICAILAVGLLLVAQRLTQASVQSEYEAIPVRVSDRPSNRVRH